jgi:hypothetical protein
MSSKSWQVTNNWPKVNQVLRRKSFRQKGLCCPSAIEFFFGVVRMAGMTKTTKQRLKEFTQEEVHQLSTELDMISGELRAFSDKLLENSFQGTISVDGGDMAWDALRLLTKWLSRADEDYKIKRLPGAKPPNGVEPIIAGKRRIRRGE